MAPALAQEKVYPRTGDRQTIYLKNVITNPNIEVGDYTIYNNFVNDPAISNRSSTRKSLPQE